MWPTTYHQRNRFKFERLLKLVPSSHCWLAISAFKGYCRDLGFQNHLLYLSHSLSHTLSASKHSKKSFYRFKVKFLSRQVNLMMPTIGNNLGTEIAQTVWPNLAQIFPLWQNVKSLWEHSSLQNSCDSQNGHSFWLLTQMSRREDCYHSIYFAQ